jgi:hypothetical protein
MQQGVQQGTGRQLPLPGCTTRPAGLSITIRCSSFEHHVERDVFGAIVARHLRHGRPRRTRRARRHRPCAWLDRRAVEADQAVLQPALQAAARMLGKQLGQRASSRQPAHSAGTLAAGAGGASAIIGRNFVRGFHHA